MLVVSKLDGSGGSGNTGLHEPGGFISVVVDCKMLLTGLVLLPLVDVLLKLLLQLGQSTVVSQVHQIVVLASCFFLLSTDLDESLKASLFVQLLEVGVLVSQNTLSVLGQEEADLGHFSLAVHDTKIKLIGDSFVLSHLESIVKLTLSSFQVGLELLSKLVAESRQLNHEVAESNRSVGHVVNVAVLALVLPVLSEGLLEVDHLLVEDLEVDSAKEVLASELELRRQIQDSFDELLGYMQSLLGLLMFVRNEAEILSSSHFQSNQQLKTKEIDVLGGS